MPVALATLGLLLVYWESLLAYLRDQHYQEHFVYLWVFLAAALWRTLEGPFRPRFGWSTARDRVGIAACIAATSLLWLSVVAGSNTGMRLSLVTFLTGLAVLAVPGWTGKRCVQHGLLLVLCFGIPYAVYFPITSKLQFGVAALIRLPAQFGLADYAVAGHTVRFPHYELTITPDCSGLGQLLTFLGIAALGVLRSGQRRSRTILVLGLAVALAWLSNLTRVGLFVGLVGLGWTGAVDSAAWHAVLGFLVYMPFVSALILVVLKTHVPLPPWQERPLPPGRLSSAWLVAPLLAVQLVWGGAGDAPGAEPAHFARLAQPPGHTMVMRAPSEANDRATYGTPWLLSARFARGDDAWFDLFHYRTRSRSHLCVHRVADCLGAGASVDDREPPVDVDGQRWWRLAFHGGPEQGATHVYFAFGLGGRRRDDSVWTQLEVVRQRALGGNWDVQLTRVVFPGPMPPAPTAYEQEVLTWLGREAPPPR